MTPAETAQLLTSIAAIDNRRIDEATVLAWHGIVDGLELGECIEAARRHFGQSTDYLMPIHIVRGVAEIADERRRAALRAQADRAAAELEAAGAERRDRSPEVTALLAALRDALPPTDPVKVRRPETLAWDRAREREQRAEPNPLYVFPATAQRQEPTP